MEFFIKISYFFGRNRWCRENFYFDRIRKRKRKGFICDDILVIDECNFYENYAYPKIYAYNVIGDKELERKILSKESFLSKLHWMIKKKINISKVRRKIFPEELYRIELEKKLSLKKIYIILSRGNYQEMKLKKLKSNIAKEITKNII